MSRVLLFCAALWLFPLPAAAQLRVEPYESMVTASGPPQSAWVRLTNDGDAPRPFEIASVVYVGRDGPVVLQVQGVATGAGPRSSLVVPPHTALLMTIYVRGVPDTAAPEAYDFRVTIADGTSRSSVVTRSVRAERLPFRP